MEKRHQWPSRWIFILAAIGSAAGLGNLWRFPYLAYEHGGAAFVVAFILAYIIIGAPLLVLEVGLGQMMQKGAADAFGEIKKIFRFVGWTALILGFMVLAYYMVIIAWGVDYFVSSFALSWGADTKTFFFNEVLRISPDVSTTGGISMPVLAGLFLVWVLVYFSVRKSVESISKVVVWTATLPFAILAILIIRAVTLEGSSEGLRLLFIPDFSAWADPGLWLAAISQVFFSLSLAFGIMIAYGSLKRQTEEITKGVVWIILGDFVISIMAGIVIFGTLGYMALEQGVSVSEVFAGGPSLAFVVFPAAINLLPSFNVIFALLFFGMLLSLAIDSAFSLLEAVTVSIRDRIPGASTKKITLAASLLGFAAGIIYTTGAGFYFLDIADHFLVDYGLVIIGIFEALIVGWFWKGNKLRDFVNERSGWKLGVLWNLAIKFVIPIFLGVLLIWNLWSEFGVPYGGYPAWALLSAGILPLLLAPFAAIVIDKLMGRHEEKPSPAA